MSRSADRADPGAGRRFHLRDLFLAVLPELPGRGAGAEPDGRAQSEDQACRDRQIEQIQALDGDFTFETYFSQSCQNCPDVVQALNLMAVLNPKIKHVAIDGALYQAEAEQRQAMSVP